MTRLLAAALLGCGAPSPPVVTVTAPVASSAQPQTVVPRPRAQSQPFIDAGCVAKGEQIDCSSSPNDALHACRWPLQHVDVTFDPPAYVAECHLTDGSPGLRTTGCMLTSNLVLFATTKKGLVRIASKQELAATFAPVETAEEAIAFAHVMTGDWPYEKPAKADDGTPMITRPTRDGSDWELRLFHNQICGCEHPVSAVDLHVSRDGTVKELRRAIAQQNASASGLCKD